MHIISSVNDIATYLQNNHPDLLDFDLVTPAVAAIQAADHPRWGSDWSEWLGEHARAIVEEVASANGRGAGPDRAGRLAAAGERGGVVITAYTYTIFDNDPSESDGNRWPSHENLAIDADDDEEAIEDVRDAMSIAAADLNPCDGYEVGQRLYALVWDEHGQIIGTPTYEITAEDLGVDPTSSEEASS